MSTTNNSGTSANSERQFSSLTSSTNTDNSFDINTYQQKKTLAEGMMDIALMSANANQLRYVISSNDDAYRYILLILIGSSVLLQIAVGVGLLWNIKYDVNRQEDMENANRMNNWTIVGIFLVTVLNVIISSFAANNMCITNSKSLPLDDEE